MGTRKSKKAQAEEAQQCLIHDLAWAKSKLGVRTTDEVLDALKHIQNYYVSYLEASVEQNIRTEIKYAMAMVRNITKLVINIEEHRVPTKGAIGNAIAQYPILINAHDDFSDLWAAGKEGAC